MPLGTWDRLPIPTLTTYTVLSAVLFVSLLYNAKQVTENPTWKNEILNDKNASDIIVNDDEHLIDLDNFHIPDSLKNVLIYMIQESFSRWVSKPIYLKLHNYVNDISINL